MKARRNVVVAGLTLNGSTVARSLARQGFTVWSISYNRAEQGWSSRFGKKYFCPNPDESYAAWLEFMLDFSGNFDEPVGILPMADSFVLALDRAAIDPSFPFKTLGMGNGLRSSLTRKIDTFQLASHHDFPCPKFAAIETREGLIAFWKSAGPHVLLKPDLSLSWRSGKAGELAGDSKVMIAGTLEELLAIYDRMAPYSSGLIAQEVIPGDDKCLIYWCGFRGPDQKVGGSLVGRKLRVVPVHFGSASLVELVEMPEVDKTCVDFLERLDYQGICGIELKEDPRDGIAKLIEVNPRYGLWDDIGSGLGVDLAREAADAFSGMPTVRSSPQSYGRKWISIGRDISAFFSYRAAGELTFLSWIKSLRPPVYVNDFPIFSDPLFALNSITSRLAKIPKKFFAGRAARKVV